MKEVKALHIITGLGVGGAEQQLRLLLRHLPMQSDVLTLTNPGPVAEGLRADGVRVVHLGMQGNRDLGALPRLVKFIRRGRYDLVHTHLYRACVYGRLAARLAGVGATVATEHSLGEGEIEGLPLSGGVRALYLASERLGAATVAVSDTVAARLEGWGCRPRGCMSYRTGSRPSASASTKGCAAPPGPAADCPNGPSWSAGSAGWCPASGSTSSYGPSPRCRGRTCCWRGTGPSVRRCSRLAGELGVQNRIHLLGERDPLGDSADGRTPGIPALLAAMDVFVSPSREEAFGLAVVEALAAGLPVLHVTCPAVDDLPADEAPGARRIGPGTEELVAALRGHMEAGARRLPPPPVVRRYDIAGSARFYSWTSTPSRWPPVPSPRPVRPRGPVCPRPGPRPRARPAPAAGTGNGTGTGTG